MEVRKNTRLSGAVAAAVHFLPPNRPWPGIRTTHCTVQSRNTSARPHGKFRRIESDQIPICEACRNVFHQWSRHIDASGAGGRGVPSIARRQIQYRSGRASQTRRKTSGAAATIPETERILRRDSRRNSRFARARAATLVRKKPVPGFPGMKSGERLRQIKARWPGYLHCIPYRAAPSGRGSSGYEARTPKV
jgi:hypothetical protein